MAGIQLNNVNKTFGAVNVIDNLSLTIEPNEFIVFLGPSGCGKSTLLRMIAGLEEIDGGEILIGGDRVDGLPPARRGVAMVFQNYALYPHMTIRENIGFGLRNVKTPPPEIARRVEDAGKLLEIEHLLDRKPAQLSGGQRQRVAIGRAIVKEPKAFLFDEPLSNLDAALRVHMRVELAQLHQRVNSTMVFVTHDQIEAMTLAQRIVVLNNRKIEQVGTPMDIYSRPASRFVASFVGSPTMNFIDVDLVDSGGPQAVVAMSDGAKVSTDIDRSVLPGDTGLTLGVRAESIRVSGTDDAHLEGVAEVIERLGDRTLVYARLSGGGIVVAEDVGKSRAAVGDHVPLRLEGSEVHLFDAEDRAYSAN